MTNEAQLDALGELHRHFEAEGVEYWLFGGWAVDFHAGAITRPHGDLDIAIWLREHAGVEQVFRGHHGGLQESEAHTFLAALAV